MARSTLLYLGMLVLLGVGFEEIRRVGNTLTPPRHIAGQWHLLFPSPFSSCPILKFAEAGKESLQVEQSGRYLTLTFGDIHHTQLRARLDGIDLQGSGPSKVACAEGNWLHFTGHLEDTGRPHDSRLAIILTPALEMSPPAVPFGALLATQYPFVSIWVPSSDSLPRTSP